VGNSGNANCTVNSLALTGSLDFALGPGAPPTPFTVAPGGSVSVPVDYIPSNTAADSGVLEIASNDPNDPLVSASLAGTGIAPPTVCDIDVGPLTLDFGSITTGTTKTLSATVGNTGNGACTVGSLALSGSPDFTLNPAAPLTPFTIVAGGAPVTVAVDYKPLSAGADSGALDIGSNDPDESPVSISLAGSATAPAGVGDIDISSFSPVSSARVGDSISLQVMVQNNGSIVASGAVTVVGVQGGAQIYKQTLQVTNLPKKYQSGYKKTLSFPSYKPVATGTISWTATVIDGDADTDQKTASTSVGSGWRW
jgi:hypothetical protein